MLLYYIVKVTDDLNISWKGVNMLFRRLMKEDAQSCKRWGDKFGHQRKSKQS
jgi:hypothetical protein